ncbi:Uncharacterised protein [uncultured Clostridium sp.]|nr:Uncharacterised protein [uncultured Clostridium sp.]SCI80634.1 Uncharacterised protein [uncultured Clostridium sp.]
MNKKKIIIIALIIIGILFFFLGFINNKPKDIENQNTNINKIEESQISENKTIKFLKSVSGIKANNIELINNPVGVKGEFLVPQKSILNGVNYFLKETKNDKISKVDININKNTVKAKVNYKVTKNITTPIEVEVVPSLNKNKDLILNVKEVKLLDLKLYKWIVDMALNSFIKDWFSKDSNISVKFNDGSVIIDKSNFKDVSLENISLDSNNLKINMIIDLNYILNKN